MIERVTARMSAKRTRTVTVRPGRDLARSRVATRSARWRSVGRNTLLVGRLPAERRLRAGRMRAAVRPDLARVAVPGERRELLARRRAEQPLQRPARRLGQLPDGGDADLGKPRLVTGPTPHISSTGRSCRNASSVAGSTTTSPSGLATCEAILARCLVRATPTEIGRPSSSRTRAPDRSRDLRRRAEQMRAAGDVGEGLVDRDALDQRREVAEHADRGVAEPLVLLEMPADEDQLRAKLARPPARHAAVHAEGLRLVGRGEHHPAADGDRLAAQRRVEQLLDRGVEGVEIGMQDGRRGFHAERSVRGRRCVQMGFYQGNIENNQNALSSSDSLWPTVCSAVPTDTEGRGSRCVVS